MPVFPLVGSMMTESGFSSPEASAASIMARAMRSFTPVSYTHLDVYKRQISRSLRSPIHCLPVDCQGIVEARAMCTMRTVSYTHLVQVPPVRQNDQVVQFDGRERKVFFIRLLNEPVAELLRGSMVCHAEMGCPSL